MQSKKKKIKKKKLKQKIRSFKTLMFTFNYFQDQLGYLV